MIIFKYSNDNYHKMKYDRGISFAFFAPVITA
jgi:hypothetical protein